MSALREVVRRHVVRPSHAGSGKQGFDRAALQRELKRLRRNREIGFWIMFVLLAVLFTGAVATIFHYRSDPSAIRGLSAATGVTAMGVVGAMISLWAQKVRIDLVIAILMGMPEESATAVLTTLVDRL